MRLEGFNKRNERPEEIKRAIAEGDVEFLRAAGRKGGRSAQDELMRRRMLKQDQLEDARQHEENLYGGHPPEDDD